MVTCLYVVQKWVELGLSHARRESALVNHVVTVTCPHLSIVGFVIACGVREMLCNVFAGWGLSGNLFVCGKEVG